MRKASELIGRPIVVSDTNTQVATVRDLIIDQQMQQILGFLVDTGDGRKGTRVLPFKDVQALGPDTISVAAKGAIVPAKRAPDLQRILRRRLALTDTKIESADGRELGVVCDIYIAEETGRIEGFQVAGGSFAGVFGADRHSEDAAQLASSAAQPDAESEHVEELQTADAESEHAEELQAAAARPPAMSEAQLEQQQRLLSGLVVHWDITAPDGEVVIRKNEQVTPPVVARLARCGYIDELYWAVGGRVADSPNDPSMLSLEDAHGLRAQTLVQVSRGLVIVSPGQIITQQVIERARMYRKERELLLASGLLSEAADSQGFTGTSRRNMARSGRQLQRLWQLLKGIVRGPRRPDVPRLKHEPDGYPLGRQVSRSIRDRHQQVILHSGDLITDESIARARQAGVLDLLLKSVAPQEHSATHHEDAFAAEGDATTVEERSEYTQQQTSERNGSAQQASVR